MGEPKLRSTTQVVEYFKERDPDTTVSINFIRKAIANGFPVLRSGRRILINLDLFIEYLNGDYVPGEKRAINFSVIEK